METQLRTEEAKQNERERTNRLIGIKLERVLYVDIESAENIRKPENYKTY